MSDLKQVVLAQIKKNLKGIKSLREKSMAENAKKLPRHPNQNQNFSRRSKRGRKGEGDS